MMDIACVVVCGVVIKKSKLKLRLPSLSVYKIQYVNKRRGLCMMSSYRLCGSVRSSARTRGTVQYKTCCNSRRIHCSDHSHISIDIDAGIGFLIIPLSIDTA